MQKQQKTIWLVAFLVIFLSASLGWGVKYFREKPKSPPVTEEEVKKPPVKAQESPQETKKAEKKAEKPAVQYVHLTEPTFGLSFDYPADLPRPEMEKLDVHSAFQAPLDLAEGFYGADFGKSGNTPKANIEYILREPDWWAKAEKSKILSDDSFLLFYPDGYVIKFCLTSAHHGMRQYIGFKIKGNLDDPQNATVKHVLASFKAGK